ncbi:hypothetical protein [Endothiovibrio diazotrophicus]
MPTRPNAPQVNIVSVVDVRKALDRGTLQGAIYMTDNSVGSAHKGTDRLSTACLGGQVVNWVIYPLEAPLDSVRVTRIAFAERAVCGKLKAYGEAIAPFGPYPERTPSYDYWAGLVLPEAPPGIHRYHFEIELRGEGGPRRFLLNSPSLRVVPTSRYLVDSNGDSVRSLLAGRGDG